MGASSCGRAENQLMHPARGKVDYSARIVGALAIAVRGEVKQTVIAFLPADGRRGCQGYGAHKHVLQSLAGVGLFKPMCVRSS